MSDSTNGNAFGNGNSNEDDYYGQTCKIEIGEKTKEGKSIYNSNHPKKYR